mgnify:CR=1 FL=1
MVPDETVKTVSTGSGVRSLCPLELHKGKKELAAAPPRPKSCSSPFSSTLSSPHEGLISSTVHLPRSSSPRAACATKASPSAATSWRKQTSSQGVSKPLRVPASSPQPHQPSRFLRASLPCYPELSFLLHRAHNSLPPAPPPSPPRALTYQC